jgi:outer membrane protein assembly factor BamB
MKRRDVIAAAVAGLTFGRAVAQDGSIKGVATNLDRHGMSDMPSGMDMASDAVITEKVAVQNQVFAVLTRSGMNTREGSYLGETKFTPASLARTPPKKLFTVTLPGDARGLEAQPLIVPNVLMPDGSTHDLLISATMGNQVYVHDANDGTPLWMMRLGNPVIGSRKIDGWMINQNWGVLSTGVVWNGSLYVVAWTSPDGTPTKGSHYLYALDLAKGVQTRAPLLLVGPSNMPRKQRSGLVIVGSRLFIAWGTIAETADDAHGFVTSVDLGTWKKLKELNTTEKGSGAGIWMAGQAPASDDKFLYFMTGNGDYDGVTNFGESFVKLDLDLNVVDHWSPFKDVDRGTGGGWDDMDLGSGGCLLIPGLDIVLGCGKDGILYVLRASNLKAGPLQPPIFFTFNGLGLNATPKDVKTLNTLVNGKTHHMHSTPVYWNGKLFCWGENGNGRWWSIDKTGKVKFIARTAEVASPYSPASPGGMPGSMMCLSANQLKDGILWAVVPDDDANRKIVTGRVFAFDVNTPGAKMADGDVSITRLWMSDPHHTFNKFNVPVVSDGKLYVPTYDGTIEVWG